MNRQEELAVGRRLLGHIDGRTTDLARAMFRNSVAAYSCRDRARLERERLFRGQPIFMGLSTRLPEPGDYRVFVQVKRAGRVVSSAFDAQVR